jgi:LAO/AO transport system kinase
MSERSATSADRTAALVDRVLVRDPRAIARTVSLIENESADALAILTRLYPHTGRAYVIGVTGPPGAGKSTLVDRLVTALRGRGSTVGVLAVDPTSPFSGGAILGDRVRLQAHASDAGVFIRSMATRGHLGGLARATVEAALVFDAAGFDFVLIETVGVGQDEVDIVRTADMSVVVLAPGMGDDVQAMKAGVMEIADVFVVNKADREGADRTAASVETILSLGESATDGWSPPVLRTEATTGRGVPELMVAIDRFRAATAGALVARRRARVEWRLREVLGRTFLRHVERYVLGPGELDEIVERVARRDLDPYRAAQSILVRACATGVRLPFEVDHVGVAVRDAREMVEMFARVFGLRTGAPETVGLHRVRFVDTGASTIELVEPASPEAPVAAFLDKRGAGLHHICLRVPDLAAAMAAVAAAGAVFIDAQPRAGAHGSRIAFIRPSSTSGLLIELKQLADDPTG